MVAKQFVAIFPVYNRPNGKRDVRGSYLIYEYGHLSHHEATASIFAWFGGGGGGDHFQSLELRSVTLDPVWCGTFNFLFT